jgi:hypothetical protein
MRRASMRCAAESFLAERLLGSHAVAQIPSRSNAAKTRQVGVMAAF